MVTSSVLPHPASETGAHVRRRLRDDLIAWLTVVADSGTPQPNPVWFLWDDEREDVLIYSKAGARRHDWITRRDQVSLHLNDDGEGHDFLVLTGTLTRLNETVAPADENAAFVDKYRRLMTEIFGEPRAYAEAFPVALRFQPRRSRPVPQS